MQGARVEEPGDIAAALQKAFAANAPYLLEVRTRGDVPMPRTGYWDIADFLVALRSGVRLVPDRRPFLRSCFHTYELARSGTSGKSVLALNFHRGDATRRFAKMRSLNQQPSPIARVGDEQDCGQKAEGGEKS